MTKPEVSFWLRVQNDQLGYRIKRQYALGPYILDFYCAKGKVNVEIDGRKHKLKRAEDAQRDTWLKNQGVTVYRISARAIFRDLDTTVALLHDFLDKLNPPTSK